MMEAITDEALVERVVQMPALPAGWELLQLSKSGHNVLFPTLIVIGSFLKEDGRPRSVAERLSLLDEVSARRVEPLLRPEPENTTIEAPTLLTLRYIANWVDYITRYSELMVGYHTDGFKTFCERVAYTCMQEARCALMKLGVHPPYEPSKFEHMNRSAIERVEPSAMLAYWESKYSGYNY